MKIMSYLQGKVCLDCFVNSAGHSIDEKSQSSQHTEQGASLRRHCSYRSLGCSTKSLIADTL